ncbi:MAG: hypothetical protein JST16_10065 [Bdellovibrionales bacterium]|nr:hypothetical protein [Bdellovibrionales bacterium]
MTTKHKVPHDPSLGEVFEDLTDATRAQLEHFDDELETVRSFVRQNPLLALLGAAAVGFMVSRMLRKERVVYMERVKS